MGDGRARYPDAVTWPKWRLSMSVTFWHELPEYKIVELSLTGRDRFLVRRALWYMAALERAPSGDPIPWHS